jgi:transcriptional regulator with XRE-family HTH domain
MKKRLLEFLSYLGIGQTKFEEKTGLSRGFVNTLKNNPTVKSLDKIEDAYPELNINWLKTGEGEMLKSDAGINETETHKTLDFSDLIKINEKTAEAVHIIANSNAKMADAIQTSARSFETLAQTNAEMWQTIKGKLDRIEELLEKKGGNAQGRAHAV